jgi:hypothetical protein
MSPTQAAAAGQVGVRKLGRSRVLIPIVGTAPLIVHRFSEKSKRVMLDAQQGKKRLKEVRDPQAEYQACFYRLADGAPGFPSVAFKSACVSAGRMFGKDLPMTLIRQAVLVVGRLGTDGMMLTAIDGEPSMREDVVRIGQGTSDLRYRAQFTAWSAVLEVVFAHSAVSLESVLALVDAAGASVGVGEWRPEKKGDSGTFEIDLSQEIVAVAL